jgi:hypothetical protein
MANTYADMRAWDPLNDPKTVLGTVYHITPQCSLNTLKTVSTMSEPPAKADLASNGKGQPRMFNKDGRPHNPDFCGKPGRSGAPMANVNASKNGTRLTRLTLGELPKTMRRQLQNARKYRRFLEGLVMDAHDEVNATHAHLVDEACAAEVHASVCRWLLRTRLETMSTSDITRCSDQIVKSKTIRNKAVTALKIDVEPEPLDLRSYVIESGNKGNGTTE